MCIIVDNQKGKKIDQEIIDNCIFYNSDGFAIYFLDNKQLVKTMDDAEAKKLLAEKRPYVAHARKKTKGKICKENIHLFESEDKRYLFAMNGTVDGFEKEGANDAKELFHICQNFVKEKHILEFLKMFTARFLIVDTKTNNIYKTGDWFEHNEVLYSKDNVLKKKTTGNQYSTGTTGSTRSTTKTLGTNTTTPAGSSNKDWLNKYPNNKKTKGLETHRDGFYKLDEKTKQYKFEFTHTEQYLTARNKRIIEARRNRCKVDDRVFGFAEDNSKKKRKNTSFWTFFTRRIPTFVSKSKL
jgi:hypothetical protein